MVVGARVLGLTRARAAFESDFTAARRRSAPRDEDEEHCFLQFWYHGKQA